MDYLEKLDAWLDGEDEGVAPLDVLRERGVAAPPAETLDDAQLHAELWRIIESLPALGIVIDSTDHLSDRDLYVRLTTDVLAEKTFMSDEPNSVWVYDLASQDTEVWLTYYADDDDRADWAKDWPDDPMPEKKPLPYDRSSRIETIEEHFGLALKEH
jgi:hypothetical protein